MRAIGACLLVVAGTLSAGDYPGDLPPDHAAIRYSDSATTDRVARLGAAKIDSLSDLLGKLGINIDSQLLVFSKTSFQAARISPENPRAIYFNDDVAVGFVPGGSGIEIAATDPRQGVIFYTFTGATGIRRSTVCLECHQGPATQGVPGIFVGSVFPNAAGQPARSAAIITDHRTPFADRWGGWFVSEAQGEMKGRANAVASNPDAPEVLDFRIAPPAGSDIVALMTFEHQTTITNMLTRLGWEARMGRVIDSDIDAAAKYMLFADEAPLKQPVNRDTSSFSRTFPLRGPRDRKGRSLRDFDLKTRLFRYYLTYMIYSAVFDGLPDHVRDELYRRIWYRMDAMPEKAAIREIVADTKPNLPEWWRTTCP